MAVYVYTTVAVVTSYEYMFPGQQKALHKSTSLSAHETHWGPPQCISAFLISWSGSTGTELRGHGRRCSAGAQAAVPQERRGGNQGSWKAREIPQFIKNQSTVNVWVCGFVESLRCSISKAVVLIPAWSWWGIITTVPLNRIINFIGYTRGTDPVMGWILDSPQNQGVFPHKVKRKKKKLETILYIKRIFLYSLLCIQ